MLSSLRSLSYLRRVKFALFLGWLCVCHLSVFIKNASKEKYLSCFSVLSVLSECLVWKMIRKYCWINEWVKESDKYPFSQAGFTITKKKEIRKLKFKFLWHSTKMGVWSHIYVTVLINTDDFSLLACELFNLACQILEGKSHISGIVGSPVVVPVFGTPWTDHERSFILFKSHWKISLDEMVLSA